jgi:phosphonate transport system substrate-binding protein
MKLILILILSCCSICNAQVEPLRLEFGVYPSDRAAVMYRKFSPILDALRIPLEIQLEREVDIHMTIFEDHESGIKALAKGEVDFVRFGPSSYILAEELNPNVQLLAMELRNGLKRFNGLIIAHKDSNIHNLQDLHGKTFAFGDENSTIGRFLSQSLLVENEIHAESLTSFDYLGRHDHVAKAVITKSYDAGALKSSTYKQLCDPEEIIVVRAFSNVTKPWVASSDLPKEVCEAITASLLILESQKVIGELGCSGFAEATPKEYDLVRAGMQKAEAFSPKTEKEVEEKD